jgi:hypothetical protein
LEVSQFLTVSHFSDDFPLAVMTFKFFSSDSSKAFVELPNVAISDCISDNSVLMSNKSFSDKFFSDGDLLGGLL